MLPVFDNESTSTKDKIISILVTQPNLNTKKINSALKKQYALNVTYQAVHKTLKLMVEQEILEHKNKAYELNPQWINNLRLFVEKIEKTDLSEQNQGKYTTKQDLKNNDIHKDQTTRTLVFPTLEKFSEYMSEMEYLFAKKDFKEQKIFIRAIKHSWWPLIDPKSEFNRIKDFKKNNVQFHVLIQGNHLLDKWTQKFFYTHNVSCKVNSKFISTCEVGIYNHAVYQIFYGPVLSSLLDKIYSEIRDVRDINFWDIFQDLWNIKEDIKVIENKDKFIIKSFKERALSEFSLEELKRDGEEIILDELELFSVESKNDMLKRIDKLNRTSKVLYV